MAFELDWEQNGLFEIPNATGTPERRLILAVLERAILDFVGNDPEEYITAETWLFEHEGMELEPGQEFPEFSFAWVCQQLDIDFIKTAQKIKAMPKRGKQRIAPWYFTKRIGEQSGEQNSDVGSEIVVEEQERLSA